MGVGRAGVVKGCEEEWSWGKRWVSCRSVVGSWLMGVEMEAEGNVERWSRSVGGGNDVEVWWVWWWTNVGDEGVC